MPRLAAFALLALGMLAFASACGGGGEPVPTPIPTAIPTPTPSAPEIKTAAGTFLVEDVELTDRFGERVAQPGYQILIVSLKPKDPDEPVSVAEREEISALIDQIYILGSDGSREDAFALVVHSETPPGGQAELTLQVAFAIPASTSAQDFELLWPGNAALDLGK